MIFKVRTASDNEFEYTAGYGYETNEDGETEPTDAQIELHDYVDNSIQEAVECIVSIYSAAANIPEINTEHDIEKLTEVRYAIEKAYGLPEVY